MRYVGMRNSPQSRGCEVNRCGCRAGVEISGGFERALDESIVRLKSTNGDWFKGTPVRQIGLLVLPKDPLDAVNLIYPSELLYTDAVACSVQAATAWRFPA